MSEQSLTAGHRPSSADSATLAVTRSVTALYVDRTSQRWVVRDTNGEFWMLPQVQDAWRHRLPFQLTNETTLEPVPGHYKPFLGVPF